MLTILGESHRFCDGVSRRSFLKIGGLAFGGLSMAELLRAEAATAARGAPPVSSNPHKAIIMVFLSGGPPHQDLFDLKPDAPAEIRGEFDPIETNVPGIQISELLPQTAAIMDKLAIVRSVVGMPHDHAAYHCITGRPRLEPQPAGGWPALGSVLSKVAGPVVPDVMPFVGLQANMWLEAWSDISPGFLGAAHGAFRPSGEMRADMVLNGITAGRLRDRKALLESFDRFQRNVDGSGLLEGTDRFHQQALNVLTSSAVLDALDLSREDERIRERYGSGGPKLIPESVDQLEAYGNLEHFLIARRLVEAGVRCVTLNFGEWDTHWENFRRVKNSLPLLDQGISALVTDLHERGLDKDVTVVVWGEFGRSPRISANAGRDHWPRVMSVLLAGGSMRTGQVIGKTDRIAGEAIERPIQFQEVFATLYHNVGIDVEHTQLTDLTGRPHYLLDHRTPIPELI